MRTTVTLEPDVERLLKQTMRQEGVSFKDAVNRAVRAGLTIRKSNQVRKPYVLKTKPMGCRSDLLPSKLLAILDEEDDLRSLGIEVK